MRILLILFLLQNLIIYKLDAKLIYNCKSVHFSAEKYKDINVVFMTGYEILENMPDKNKSIVKSKKYAMVLISEEKMMIVELDEPTINSKSAIEMGVAGLNGRTPNIEDLAAQESNQDDDAFYFEYILDLPVDDTTYKVNFKDWMFLLDKNTLIARSYMSKWGFYLGEVTIVMNKKG